MFIIEHLFWIIFLSEPWLWKHVADPDLPDVLSAANTIYLPSPGCGRYARSCSCFPQRARFPSPVTRRILIHCKYGLLLVVLRVLDGTNQFLPNYIHRMNTCFGKCVVCGKCVYWNLNNPKKNPENIDLCVCKSVIENDNRTQHLYFLISVKRMLFSPGVRFSPLRWFWEVMFMSTNHIIFEADLYISVQCLCLHILQETTLLDFLSHFSCDAIGLFYSSV